MNYADIRNKTILLKILEEPKFRPLATSFLKTFLGINAVKASGSSFAETLFIAKGSFNDDIELIVIDDEGKKHLIHIRFLELHLGITDGYFEIEKYKLRDLRMHTRAKKFRHSFCQNVRELCFFSFNISTQPDCYSVRQYNFNELPFLIRFDCYELNKFNFNDNLSEKEIWLQIIKNGFDPVDKLPKTPFLKSLKKVFIMDKWDDVDMMFYKSRQKHLDERQTSILKLYKERNISLDEKYLKKSSKNADWNWDILEYQLGKLPKNRVESDEIDIENLSTDLSKLTFTLFRKWTTNCQVKYPNIDLTIIDERILIADIKKKVKESLIAVFDNETFYRKERSKIFAIDYFIGHLEGSLGRHWYTEYVLKTKDEFKTIMALRSLKLFLDLEDVMRIQVEHIYQEVIKDKVNLSNPSMDISKIDLKSNDGNKIIESNDAQTNVQTVLVNLTNEYIQKLGKIEAENFDLNVADYVNETEVLKFIESNWRLFLPQK